MAFEFQQHTPHMKPPPTRLLHIITGLGTGGAEMMLYKLLSRQNRDRFDPMVITLTESGPVGEMIEELGIPVVALHFTPGGISLKDILTLIRQVRKIRPHLIQTWLYKADLLGGLAARFTGGIPVVWGIRASILDHENTARSTLLARRLCAMTSGILPRAIVSCSHVGADVHVALGYAKRKIQVIPNGFDSSEFTPDPTSRLAIRAKLGLEEGMPMLVHIGRFDPLKDYPNLLNAAGILRSRGSEFRLLMCGLGIDQDNEALTSLVNTLDLENHVQLLGPRKDVRLLLQGADIMVSSSVGEGFPNVIGEAMASGVPCAVTDAGDSAMIVGDSGRVAPVSDPAALAGAMSQLLTLAPEARAALGRAARERIGNHFELDDVVRRFEALYRELLGVTDTDGSSSTTSI